MGFDQKAYETEKKVWVYVTGTGTCWHKPSYIGWMLMNDGEPLTKKEADEWVWESRCDYTNSNGEFEECNACHGEGCEDCDFEGGWSEEWSEVVERETYAYLEEYDPAVHFKVESDFPEHLLWRAESTFEAAAREEKRMAAKVLELTKELEATVLVWRDSQAVTQTARLNLKMTQLKHGAK